jgi:DNA polymerase-3 subunit beta
MLFTGNTELPASFILPQKPASLLRTVLSPEDESTVTLRFNEKNAEFVLPDGILTCLLIEGKFPNYKNVIPTDNPNVITIDRKSLISALKRILPFSNENTELVKLRLSQSNMEVLAEDADFATYAQEDIMCDYNGTPMTIGFKGTTLTDILNNLTGEDVVIELGDPSRAGVIRPCVQPEKEDVLMLIMPMLIND